MTVSLMHNKGGGSPKNSTLIDVSRRLWKTDGADAANCSRCGKVAARKVWSCIVAL